MNEPPRPAVVVCSSVLAVPAFSQKGKDIVSFNLFIKMLEQLEHWNTGTLEQPPTTPQASASLCSASIHIIRTPVSLRKSIGERV